jgi:hypothetical protein
MPFQRRGHFDVASIDFEAEIFRKLLAIAASSSLKKFKAAKDDYRLLAIDTIADSRRSRSIYLQFAQTWMAIERVLAVRSETSVQLAIALAAFYPAGERPGAFEEIRTLYTLRSNIVHGYSFERSGDMTAQMTTLTDLFRRLLKTALDHAKSGELAKALRDHVLRGEPQPFDTLGKGEDSLERQ